MMNLKDKVNEMSKYYKTKKEVVQHEKKKDDEHARVRNVIVNFRVSPKEKELIDARIKMTGMLKSDFFIESCLYQKILVKGNINSFTKIKNKIQEIAEVIEKNPKLENLEPELCESLKTILEILNALFGKGKIDNERSRNMCIENNVDCSYYKKQYCYYSQMMDKLKTMLPCQRKE